MQKRQLIAYLWGFAVVVCLFPAALVVLAAFVPWAVTFFGSLLNWSRMTGDVWRSIGLMTTMEVGGILGLIAICLATDTARLAREPKRMAVALLFAAAGFVADVLYVHTEGWKSELGRPFNAWQILGPVIVGAVYLIRVLWFRCQLCSPSVTR
jgi:ABC-type Fe3+ transport system permease subunit